MSILTTAEAGPIFTLGQLRNNASRRWHKIASALTSVSCEDTEQICISPPGLVAPW